MATVTDDLYRLVNELRAMTVELDNEIEAGDLTLVAEHGDEVAVIGQTIRELANEARA
jgi:hypothetical protein